MSKTTNQTMHKRMQRYVVLHTMNIMLTLFNLERGGISSSIQQCLLFDPKNDHERSLMIFECYIGISMNFLFLSVYTRNIAMRTVCELENGQSTMKSIFLDGIMSMYKSLMEMDHYR